MKKTLFVSIIISSILFAACSTPPETSIIPHKPIVVTSFYPLYFLATQIAGDNADVSNLVPTGVEPHDYELTPQDLGNIEGSNLLIVNGLLEPWFADVEENLKGENISILNLSEQIDLLRATGKESNPLGKDPHFWLDPIRMIQMADSITVALTKADPINAAVYAANAKLLDQKFTDLDTEFKTGLSACAQKSFVTSHAAFAYLAQRYGLEQLSISGLSPDQEPSAQDMKEIVDFVRTNNVKIIFFESLVNPALAQTIANEVGAQTMVLNPIEGLTKEQSATGDDYFVEMRNNLANLKVALVCQ